MKFAKPFIKFTLYGAVVFMALAGLVLVYQNTQQFAPQPYLQVGPLAVYVNPANGVVVPYSGDPPAACRFSGALVNGRIVCVDLGHSYNELLAKGGTP